MKKFKFNITTEPSPEVIKEFHDGLAKSLIAKYGEATMKEVVKQIKLRNKTNVNKDK